MTGTPGAAAGTPAVNPNAPVPNIMANHAERPEKFSVLNFKKQQLKMLFYLTILNLDRFLETALVIVEGQTVAQSLNAVEWKHSKFLCHNYVLNGLIDALYNVYCKVATAKELWESLERKYKTKDAGTKKHVVAKFLEYKMIDSKSVMSKVQDLQVIIHDNNEEGMDLNESFQVASMVEKLPLGWIDFKKYLKHKRKELSVEELAVRLRIEEDNRMDLKKGSEVESSKVYTVKARHTSKRKGKGPHKGKANGKNLGPKAGTFNKKFKCYNYG
ncbi:uncharacterized protein LOC111901498 [Lactuca sativa]|uniref:uncharacterized protein LOC111901498 n=1 Tax=Lactuca sativa TaxID=4236 RepID=UPI000CD878D4|nr:uncharacterized protein LOC111901498 [Lactuca sativa]